jgi:hypothetical protein
MSRPFTLFLASLMGLMFSAEVYAAGHTVSITNTDVSCNSGCDGTAAASVTGGTGPFSYLWTPGNMTTSNVSNLCAGTYTCTVTDNSDMSVATATVSISQPPPLSVTASSTASCSNSCNGMLSASVTGGVPPYNYCWSTSPGCTSMICPQSSCFTVCPGTYYVTVTDANGCTASSSVTVGSNAAPNVTVSPSSPTICTGGSVALSASGANTYTWSPATGLNTTTGATVVATPMSTTTYTVTGVAVNGCSSSATVTVNVVSNPSVTLSSTAVSCNSACDGTLSAAVAGGTPPYSYNWNTPVQCMATNCTVICAGTYTCTVVDANGCTVTGSTTVSQPQAITLSFATTNVSCANGNNGNATVMATGGTGTYTYSWSTNPVQTTQTAINLFPGSYTCTVTDGNNCSMSGVVIVTSPPTISVTSSAVPAGCNASDGSISTSPSGGTPPYSYQWQPSSSTSPGLSNVPSGTYTLSIVDANGCSFTDVIVLGDSCDYVWPGDANDDAVADNLDILDIGLANGTTGTARPNASLTWVGQPSPAWGTTLPSGVDHKFTDCNGDGLIDNSDTTAVVQNYGLVHNNRLSNTTPYLLNAPDLYVNVITDTVAASSPLTVSIGLGSASLPATDIYGIAFTLNFDPALIDPNSFSLTTGSSWIGTNGTDLIGVKFSNFASAGFVDVAITRTDQNNISGFGTIGTLGMITSNSLTGTGNSQQLNFSLSNVTLISNAGVPIATNQVGDSTVVADPAIITAINEEAGSTAAVSVMPNPFKETAVITVQGNTLSKASLELYNSLGEKVAVVNAEGSSFEIIRNGLATGIYLFRIISDGTVVSTGKLIAQ